MGIAGLVLAGCSTATSSHTSRLAEASMARTHLLRASDLAAGWTVHRASPGGSRPCSDPPAVATIVGPSGAGAVFGPRGNLPVLLEYLIDGSATSASYLDAIERLETPSSCAETVDGQTESSTFEQVIAAPHFGDRSVAMLVSDDADGTVTEVGYNVVHAGSTVLVVGYADAGPLDTAALDRFTRLALRRL
jgi:hypothetical protein